jgi:ParB-like nuclease domain
MTVATLKAVPPPPGGAELVPRYLDPELIVTPDDNPAHSPARIADLAASIRELGQLVPGWVAPSPDLPSQEHRLCLEGNGRLAAVRLLGQRFWAFDLGRFVPEEERIRLMFHHHATRRKMSREETAERAARYIEITGCPAAEAAKVLGCSAPTLSRAFGEKRIPPELKPRTEMLGLAVRSLVAASPLELMPQVVDFALTPKADGKKPTRDQVALFIQQLKKQSGKPRDRKTKAITLRLNGRAVTLAVGERDSASTVAEDLKAIVARLGRHADVPPDGWPFLFQQ